MRAVRKLPGSHAGQLARRDVSPLLTYLLSRRPFSTEAVRPPQSKSKPLSRAGTPREDVLASIDILDRGTLVEVDIDGLDNLGIGYGTYTTAFGKTFTIKVNRAIPGQKVRAFVLGMADYLTAVAGINEVLRETEDRVEPVCQHYKDCGGCSLQEIPYQRQLEHKTRLVKDACIKIVGEKEAEAVRPIAGMRVPYRFRNKMEFSFSSRIWTPRAETEASKEDFNGGAPRNDGRGELELIEKRTEDEGVVEDRDIAGSGKVENREESLSSDDVTSADQADYHKNVRVGLGLMHKAGVVPRGYKWDRNQRRAPRKVVEIQHCWISPPAFSEIVATVREEANKLGLQPFNSWRKKTGGFLTNLVLRRGHFEGEMHIMVDIVTSYKAPEKIRPIVDALERLELEDDANGMKVVIKSIVNRVDERANRHLENVNRDCSLTVFRGEPYIHTEFLGRIFRISPVSFFQTNYQMASQMFSYVVKSCQAVPGLDRAVVWDLFTGTGVLAICVAPWVHQVFGVDVVHEAIEDAKVNASLNHLDNVQFFRCDLNSTKSKALELLRGLPSPDIVILDPPRSGVGTTLLWALNTLRPRRIIYVACNHEVLMKDLKLLCEPKYGSYDLTALQPFDMFPNSMHIEVVAVLDLRR